MSLAPVAQLKTVTNFADTISEEYIWKNGRSHPPFTAIGKINTMGVSRGMRSDILPNIFQQNKEMWFGRIRGSVSTHVMHLCLLLLCTFKAHCTAIIHYGLAVLQNLSKFSSMIWITIAGVSEAYISAMWQLMGKRPETGTLQY